ncbi:hypothetical protein FE254_20600 [Ectopseudomonas guguanensis]|uniref:Uncharacterized protein n=2 Tax=Pseudomonadales TaxID=72274 RepID=A0A653B1A5_ECTOL|nr:hypothetical protein FE254_20600 [Pseudomonas guguanensis]CAE6947982.1 HTH luxR-type domain-containing protein [Pseudomonas oleovorans]
MLKGYGMIRIPDLYYRQLIEVINDCILYRGVESIEKALSWTMEITDCTGIVYCEVGSSNSELKRFVNCSYSEDWVKEYFGHGFHQVDPVISKAQSRYGLHSWPGQTGEIPMEQKIFLEAAQDYGLTSGLVCSAARSGEEDERSSICSMAIKDDGKETQLSQFVLENIVPALQVAAGEIFDEPAEDCPLSLREVEVLRWVAAGKTSWEAGAVLNISEATIKFHLSNVYRKLNITTRAQAISHAIQMGWL